MLYDVGSHLGVGTVVEPTPPTELCQDMADVLDDYGAKETLTVYRVSVAYDASNMATETWALQGTFSGDWQPLTGEVMREERGLKIKSTAMIQAACDIDVENDDKVYRDDGTFEYVNYVKIWHGHTTVFMKKEKGSR